jgi:hypothetical protein
MYINMEKRTLIGAAARVGEMRLMQRTPATSIALRKMVKITFDNAHTTRPN